jgi:CheY-like chemotaxis protein
LEFHLSKEEEGTIVSLFDELLRDRGHYYIVVMLASNAIKLVELLMMPDPLLNDYMLPGETLVLEGFAETCI